MSFLRSPSQSQVVTPQYTGVQVQASSSALPIPIVWGTTIVAPNMLWNADFTAVPQYSTPSGGKGFLGGGGGSQLTGYIYLTAMVLGLCEGPIAGVNWVYNGQTVYALSTLGLAALNGPTPQTPWAYLSANHPTQALGYNGTALVVAPSYDLGSSSSIGQLSFEVVGAFAGTGVSSGYTEPANGGADADPAQVIFDFLTNAQYGVGFPAASIAAAALFGASGDASYQTYCAASGIAFSPALTNQEAGNSVLARWLQLTNATAVWSGGLLKIIPFGDVSVTGTALTGSPVTFNPNATPVYALGDDDYIGGTDADPVIVTRTDPYSASNVVNLEVLSRAPMTQSGSQVPTFNQYGVQTAGFPNYYAPMPVQAFDQNAVELYGLRIGSTITAHEICDIGIGAIVAQLILQRGLYIRNSYAFKLSWDYGLLEPMDIVTLTDANLGLASTPVRILEIAEDSDGLLSVTAEEYPGAVAATPGRKVTPVANNPINRAVAPAAVNPPVILEPPSDLTGGVARLEVGLSGGASGIADPNWGGAAIFASTDNATYTQVGSAGQPNRQGVLTAALGAPPGSPSDTLAVSFAESGATVVAGPTPTLIVVDGEILSFASGTLTGAKTYSLGGLKRKLYGQRGGAHAIGAQALILDASVFVYTLPANLIGVPLWFKFASFNIFGGAQQSLAACTAYQYTPVGSGLFGPVAQAIAAGTSLDEGLASAAVGESDDYGLASDPYTRTIDVGLASEAAAALAVQSGGTGAVTATGARANIGAAAAGANADITSLSGLTTPLATTEGGTGAATAASARSSLGAAASGANADITSLLSVLKLQGGSTQSLTIDPATGHVGLAGYTADANNALGVAGTACLFAASTDSMRFTFSKVAAANDATLSFQTNFSARALLGTTGSDALQLKVSPDGATFYQVFVCDQTTGNAAFKALLSLATYTVASLPAGLNGALAFASNGRKLGEAAGSGTGVVAAFSNGQWRRLSDDAVVAA